MPDRIETPQHTVYPRAYGGTAVWEAFVQAPRRSIPARTGDPRPRHRRGLNLWVYPSAYAGTLYPDLLPLILEGLSPRVRGNPVRDVHTSRSLRHMVYPRAYGGTRMRFSSGPRLLMQGLSPRVRGNPGAPRKGRLLSLRNGLSPRVRGNLALKGAAAGRDRSIPARTGEPAAPPSPADFSEVYPRAYGGTRTCGQRP